MIGFFSIFALVGILVGLGLGYAVYQSIEPHFWTQTPCTIIESRRAEAGVEPDRAKDFVIRYRYQVDGRDHTSDQFTTGIKESLSTSKIERLLLTHPPGSSSQCYVNPKNPNEAVLQRGALWFVAFLLLPGAFLAVGVGGLIALLRPKKPAGRTATTSRASSGIGSRIGALVLSLLLTLAGGGLAYFLGIRSVLTWNDARTWPATPCDIISSRVGVHSSSDRNSSATYSTDIVYRYYVNGREYRSDRVAIFGGSSSGRSGKDAVVAQYSAGTQAVCYVNPKDPLDALLNRDLSWLILFALIPALFFLGGVSGLFNNLRSLVRASGTVSSILPGMPPTLPGAAPTLPGAVPAPPSATGGGSIILTPSASPIAKFVGSLFFALVWNGITSIFVIRAVKSWLGGSPEIFLSLVITPFALVGLAIIVLCGMTFLNLFNPRVALAVNSQSIPLGGTLEIRWNFRGAVSRLRRFRIVLEGREEARYRRGTSNYVDRETFASLVVVETENPQRIGDGHVQFVVPDSLMHTWNGGDNQIVWQLKVAGEIPFYPDVDEDFTFTILPRAL
jgi:hypothetical protein